MLFRCRVIEVRYYEVEYVVEASSTGEAARRALAGETAHEGEALFGCVHERHLVGFPVPRQSGAEPHNSMAAPPHKD